MERLYKGFKPPAFNYHQMSNKLPIQQGKQQQLLAVY
ncbi:hypothetical protein B6N60_01075 [Richelia sinica FACHB-800]|uniref:Uncharacterized protein n=1 Tax=Richelia sinica FACHB-800 TaxID=1357546 RepID=A0A975Y3R9_9NOST|nr:hypothetical protein B6N60_01075 [Richelia sinica FACHB-800]